MSNETIERVIDDLETKAAESLQEFKDGIPSSFQLYEAYQYGVEELKKALQDG